MALPRADLPGAALGAGVCELACAVTAPPVQAGNRRHREVDYQGQDPGSPAALPRHMSHKTQQPAEAQTRREAKRQAASSGGSGDNLIFDDTC